MGIVEIALLVLAFIVGIGIIGAAVLLFLMSDSPL